MIHVRTQARNQVAAAMQGILMADGVTPVPVYVSRTVPVSVDQYPLICLYAPRDVVTVVAGRTPGNRIYRRAITFRILVYFGRPEDVVNTLEDDADAVLLQVENRMSAGFSLNGANGQSVALKATLAGIESAPVDAGAATLAVMGPSYTVLVDHHESDASVALPQVQQRP